MTNIYQVEVYNYPTQITVTADTKEHAIIRARDEFASMVKHQMMSCRVYKTKIIYIEKC